MTRHAWTREGVRYEVERDEDATALRRDDIRMGFYPRDLRGKLPLDTAVKNDVLDELLDLAERLRKAEERATRWEPMATAPKGGGADRVSDPAWVEPPQVLLLFEEGDVAIGKWDWYYAEGGDGAEQSKGVAWVEPSGELLVLMYDPPVAWRELPEGPK